MGRSRSPVLRYTLHKSSGQARVCYGGREVYLGVYNSPESLAEYERICAEIRAAAQTATVARVERHQTTVNEVLLAFARHAADHYRKPDGTPTTELKEYRAALGPLHELYGHTPAAEFGPLALQSYRRRLIDRGWCRIRVNKQVGRVRRVFRWAAAQEVVPAAVPQALACVQGLQKGRTDARESEPVAPVPAEHVAATLPYLNRHARAMAELQLLTGMRPGEACGLTLGEVLRDGGVWVYRPGSHKTAHHGKDRVVPLGPRARAVLTRFLAGEHPPPDGFAGIDPSDATGRLVAADAYQEAGRERAAALLRDTARVLVFVEGCVVDPAAPLFNPRVAREERFRTMRANRKSKVPPSQANRRVGNPRRLPKTV